MFEVTTPRVTAPRSTARFAGEMAFLHYCAARFGPEIAAYGHGQRERYWAAEAVQRRAVEERASNRHWLDMDALPWNTD